MYIVGVDPSYNGLGITVYNTEDFSLNFHMMRRKNLGTKYWEFSLHATSMRDEYLSFFEALNDFYIVFFELPVMKSRFAVGMFTLDTLLLDVHRKDSYCLHIGLYNSNYLANFRKGMRSLPKKDLKELGKQVLGVYEGMSTCTVQPVKWNADLAASLIFMSSGLITLYRVVRGHYQLSSKLEGDGMVYPPGSLDGEPKETIHPSLEGKASNGLKAMVMSIRDYPNQKNNNDNNNENNNFKKRSKDDKDDSKDDGENTYLYKPGAFKPVRPALSTYSGFAVSCPKGKTTEANYEVYMLIKLATKLLKFGKVNDYRWKSPVAALVGKDMWEPGKLLGEEK